MSNRLSRRLAVVVVALSGLPVHAQSAGDPPSQPVAVPPPAIAPATSPPAEPRIKPVSNPPFSMFKNEKLPMIQRSVLNNVSGRIDHLGVDLISGRLYVAAKNSGTLEMLDVQGSKQQPPVTGLSEPQGVVVVSDLRKLVISCGGDNSVRIYQLDPNGEPKEERVLNFAGETDPIRYDAANKRVFVGHGRNLGSFHIETGEKGPSLELPGMPEGFVIDPTSNRIFVNIAQSGTIVVVERGDAGELKLSQTWTLKDVKGNYPMAFDPSSGHLFVVSRNPSKFLAIDTKTGSEVAAVEVTDDADDCWWDIVQKRIYVSAGGSGGFVDCYQQNSEGGKVTGYTRYHQQRTNVGCRTSVFVPEQRRLIVAAPSLGSDPTFIYVFIVGP